MDNNDLKKLSRRELLEMLYEQSRRMDEQQVRIDELNEQLANKIMIMENAGSIADAALQLSEIFDVAQEAADAYVDSVKESRELRVPSMPDMDLFKRALKISIVYSDKINKDMRELGREFNEFSKVLKIMEESLK